MTLKSSLDMAAEETALDAAADEAWRSVLDLCGDQIRDDVPAPKPDDSIEKQVFARSYTVKQAAKLASVSSSALRHAAEELALDSFVDPRGKLRFPAETLIPTAADPDLREMIAGYERLRLSELQTVLDMDKRKMDAAIHDAGLSPKRMVWRDLRGLWALPETYAEFSQRLAETESAGERDKRKRRRGGRARGRRKRQAETRLRNRLIDAFPKWRNEYRHQQKLHIHIGEPNSGKTHDALEALKRAGSGWYLAPLRLLAYEVFDRLNDEGVACHLLTGEEYIPVEGAQITAATIEMFNAAKGGACVIIDEAQMLADADRGWAWTRALMESAAPEMHIIGPPTARKLIEVLASAAEIPCELVEHERLAPIALAERHFTLESLPASTILVAFTRQGVLDLKMKLERLGRTVSVVYGSLPPEVRRRQADRFADGETEICVATDAVGMGLNLPADVVCFFEVEKFDGKNDRRLYPSEVHQIGGRAGRYGMSKAGLIAATNKHDLGVIRDLYERQPAELSFARVAPTADDLKLIPGSLAEQLAQWAELKSIPEALRAVITTADMDERIALAKMLSDEEIQKLGLASALQLVNAPTRKATRPYWLDCAAMILEGYQIPLPPDAPAPIHDGGDLEATEYAIACADIYLWLSRRAEFAVHCEAHGQVREERREWSLSIDEALLRNLNMARRCRSCGRLMPSRHRYRICDKCFHTRRF
ncbi:MAG: helicase-related protein [Chloroflexota bacterium]|nr:helicase-related protein [Chloroflexota bacterium]